jgi:hypothetical protein
MRKKAPAKTPEKGDPSMIDWANGLTFFQIKGMMLGRIAHSGPGRCEDCGAKPKKLHIIPCKLEESPCGLHETAWECTCEFHKDTE